MFDPSARPLVPENEQTFTIPMSRFKAMLETMNDSALFQEAFSIIKKKNKQKHMKIDHLAIWCDDIESMRMFYTKYFGCTSNTLYINPKKAYQSYFLSFREGCSRIELMNRTDIIDEPVHRGFMKGIAHFDITVASEADVNAMHDRLKGDGFTIASELSHTGDGYYEFAVLDPEGNYIEISAEK